MKTVIVLVGLPGSGKTHKATELLEQEILTHKITTGENTYIHNPAGYRVCEGMVVYDIDYYVIQSNRSIGNVLKMCDLNNKEGIVILDGPFFDTLSYKRIMLGLEYSNIIFYYFEEDRETCLFNDRYRREENCNNTIKYAKYDIPDIEILKKIDENVEIYFQKIVRKSNYQLFLDKYKLDDENLTSERWCLGGNSGNCWGDVTIYNAEEELELHNWNELQCILIDFDFLIRDEIYYIIETKYENNRDYYGGSVEYGWYNICIESIYKIIENEFLKTEGLI